MFGVGDKTKGGVMSLQEKMNLADDVQEGESSDEEDPNQIDSSATPNKQANADDVVDGMNPQSASMNESIRSSLSA